MKNISQERVNKILGIWQMSSCSERDRVVWEKFFTIPSNEKSFASENIPMFSDNNKDSTMTDELISKLREVGVDNIVIDVLPRSTLSIVRVGDITIPPMPAHKAIALLGYVLAMAEQEI